MKRIAPLVALLAALIVDLGAAGPARAQSPAEVAMAEGLFNQGVKLLEQKKYAEACDMLERSRKLAPGLGVTLYLADCQENNNRPAAALTLFREAEKLAAARKDARQQIAKDRGDKLEKSVPRLTLRVSPEVAAAGQQVILDGRKLDAKEYGQPMIVEPGVRKIKSMSEDGTAWESDVTAVMGGTTALDIPLLRPARTGPTPVPVPTPAPTPAPPPAEPVTTPPPKDEGPSTGNTQRIAGLVVAGVGVVGLGLGTVFGLSASSKKSDSNADGHCDAADKCDPTGLSLRSDAMSSATLSTVFFIVGAAAIGGGAVLYLTAPKAGKTSGLAIAPAVSAGQAGFLARGTF